MAKGVFKTGLAGASSRSRSAALVCTAAAPGQDHAAGGGRLHQGQVRGWDCHKRQGQGRGERGARHARWPLKGRVPRRGRHHQQGQGQGQGRGEIRAKTWASAWRSWACKNAPPRTRTWPGAAQLPRARSRPGAARPSKCLQHHQQCWCEILRTGVNIKCFVTD